MEPIKIQQVSDPNNFHFLRNLTFAYIEESANIDGDLNTTFTRRHAYAEKMMLENVGVKIPTHGDIQSIDWKFYIIDKDKFIVAKMSYDGDTLIIQSR